MSHIAEFMRWYEHAKVIMETLFENVPNISSHPTLVANKMILPKKFRIEKCHFYVWLSLERSDSYDLKWGNISSLAKRWWIRSEFVRKHFDDSSKLLIRIHIETKLIFSVKWKKTYENTPITHLLSTFSRKRFWGQTIFYQISKFEMM